jgi:hypothetical protein
MRRHFRELRADVLSNALLLLTMFQVLKGI